MKLNRSFAILLLGFVTLAQASFDQKLSNISHQHFAIENEAKTLTRQFEVAITSQNFATLKAIIEHSKPLTTINITLLRNEAEEILDLVDNGIISHPLFNRLNLLQELAGVNACGRLLRTIQLEASGVITGAITPASAPRYVHSDEVALAGEAMNGRLAKVMAKLKEADTLMESARTNNSHAPVNLTHTAALEGQTRVKVLQLLKDFSNEMTPLKRELEMVYYGEVERLRLKGEEMHLLPRFLLFDLVIDVINSSVELAQKYVRAIEEHDKF
ncbi:hypothetical protein TYRP_001446 [Tyrophagus putrescentiae]|nr:hypothetical protein TYRP_001446 [Tyrophagus putrescentiae]